MTKRPVNWGEDQVMLTYPPFERQGFLLSEKMCISIYICNWLELNPHFILNANNKYMVPPPTVHTSEDVTPTNAFYTPAYKIYREHSFRRPGVRWIIYVQHIFHHPFNNYLFEPVRQCCVPSTSNSYLISRGFVNHNSIWCSVWSWSCGLGEINNHW